jgi:hypothetical protein
LSSEKAKLSIPTDNVTKWSNLPGRRVIRR